MLIAAVDGIVIYHHLSFMMLLLLIPFNNSQSASFSTPAAQSFETNKIKLTSDQ